EPVVEVINKKTKRVFELTAVDGEIIAKELPDGLRVKTTKFELDRGGRTSFSARMLLGEKALGRGPQVPRRAADVLPFMAGRWKVEMQTVGPKRPADATPFVGNMVCDFVANGKVLRSRVVWRTEFGEPLFLESFDADKNALYRWVALSSGVARGPIVGAFN